MDPDDARHDLELARRAYTSAVEPSLPRWAPPTCGALVGSAITVAGYSPSPGWLKALSILAGLLLALAAAYVVSRSRGRQGVRGVRGPAKDQWSTTVAAAAAVLVCALASSPELRWIYLMAGVAAGGYTWWALRKRVRA